MKHTMCAQFKFIFFLQFLFLWVNCSKNTAEIKCSVKDTCSSCIREIGCAWCNNHDNTTVFSSNKTNIHKCIHENEIKTNPNLCKNAINPKTITTVIEKKPLTTGVNSVQISPQKVRIRLRRGQEYKLEFTYAQAKDYPVDLYYIIDNSYSMWEFKNKLSKLSTKLANTMKKLTINFKLGFGSFIEKTVMPFVDTRPDKLKNPCRGSWCASPYLFKNHLSLTNDTFRFQKVVKDTYYSTNLDDPEGDLDALMQAIVCREEIGWRENARHLLVLSTDSEYHFAGDGKLAGIVMPHDGKCHMENHTYTYGSVFDYPSISQINAKVIEHNINVIFAVAQPAEVYYKLLKNRIKNSEFGVISEDSSNIIDLIIGYYNKIVDSVKISDNSPNNIEVKYYSACTGNKSKETNKCDNLHVGVQVNFTAVIKVLNCPESGNRQQKFQIKPGALNESLTVELELLCDCDCEKPGHKDYKIKAKECSNQGTLKCGVCDCADGKLGSNCECDGKNITAVKNTNKCKPDDSNELCSGSGTCICNKCVCNRRNDETERIYGKYCECNNYSCKRHRNKVCSGETRGNCECGKCSCLSGYNGDACECPDNNNACIKDADKKVCSGRGECKCGQCECKIVDGYIYSGKYCDECPSCPGSRCEEFRHCVECILYKNGIYNQSECAKYCTKYNVEQSKKIDKEQLQSNEKFCIYPDATAANCHFIYKYTYDGFDTINIFAQKDKVCSETNTLALVLYVIGSILIGGIIILLIWKCITTVHDRNEFAKFEIEKKNAKWNHCGNPLFKNATTVFPNPSFESY